MMTKQEKGFSSKVMGKKDERVDGDGEKKPLIASEKNNGNNNNNDKNNNDKNKKEGGERVSKRIAYYSLFTLTYINVLNYCERYVLAGMKDQVKSHFSLSDARSLPPSSSLSLYYNIYNHIIFILIHPLI